MRGILNENMSTERYMLHTFGKDNKGRVRTKVYDNQQKCYCKSGWYNINGKYYFVGSDEYLLMGWQENVDGRKKYTLLDQIGICTLAGCHLEVQDIT